MGSSQKHYLVDGVKHSGDYHKMPNGELHSGVKRTKDSKKLYHYSTLPSVSAKKRARKRA